MLHSLFFLKGGQYMFKNNIVTKSDFLNAFGINLEQFFNGTKSVDVIPTTAGKTDIYAVRIGQDGFHGVSPTGTKIINSYMPDLTLPGAVKEGEVELVAGVVLKNTRAAAVLRGVKIKAA